MDPEHDLTPERWSAAKAVLIGESKDHCSFSAAAKAAGVPLRVLRSWIKRSQKKLSDDPEWIHEIAEIADTLDEVHADKMRDLLWARANNGCRHSITKLLEKRDSKPVSYTHLTLPTKA